MRTVSVVNFSLLLSPLLISLSVSALPVALDFDGDGLDDLATFNSRDGSFIVRNSSNIQVTSGVFDVALPVGVTSAPGDFDGDGRTELAVFNPRTSEWYFRPTNGNPQFGLQFGDRAGVPVVADYDNDGRSDAATFRRGTWKILRSTDATTLELSFGLETDIPVPGDFDGDGTVDLAVYRPAVGQGVGSFFYRNNVGNPVELPFGLAGDMPCPGDLDGDGDVDAAVFRPTTGAFFFRDAFGGALQFSWGLAGDVPVSGDVDGDGKVDLIVYRPATGSFFISSSGLAQFTDIAVSPAQTGTFPAQFFLPVGSLPRGVLGDVDGDGRTDLAIAGLATGLTSWRIASPLSGATASSDFAITTDFVALGDLDGDLRSEPVNVAEISGALVWFKNSFGAATGQTTAESFGLDGDSVYVGDTDGDGTSDLIVSRVIGGVLHWFDSTSAGTARFNPFFIFGLDGDSAFVADVTGDGRVEPVVARIVNGAMNWFVGDGNSNPAPISWGLDGDNLLPPMDFDGDRRADFVVIRGTGNSQVAYIRFADGNSAAVALTFGGQALSGFFSGAGRAEMASYVSGSNPSVTVYKFDGSTFAIAITAPPGSRKTLSPSGTVVGSSGLAALLAVCPGGIAEWPGSGLLWKPESDHSGPPRVGRPLAIFSNNKPGSSCLKIFAENGEQVSQVGKYPEENLYGARYYTGFDCGDLKYASEIEEAALIASGSISTYLEGRDGVCFGPFEATHRTGQR